MKPCVDIGSIILVQKEDSFIGRLVRRFSTMPNEKPAKVEHVALGAGDGVVVEATFKGVRLSNFNKYDPEKYRLKIVVPWVLTARDRYSILKRANKYIGKKYGFGRIVAHAGDWFLSKFKKEEVKFFRKKLEEEDYPICSWFVSWAYEAIGVEFGMKKKFVQPDDIDRYVTYSGWKIIYNTLK